MNIAEAIAVDRAVSELQEAQYQIAQQLSYIRQLEAAVVSVPLYRSAGNVQGYLARVREWVNTHRTTLDRAHQDPTRDRLKLKARIQTKVQLVRDRVETWIKREAMGDATVPTDLGNKMWSILSAELIKAF